MEAARNAIEPQYLAQAMSQRVSVRIGQMNKSEHEGVIREIGRYEINVEAQGSVITILKQDISFLSSPAILVQPSPAGRLAAEQTAAPSDARPNIQQEFLDKAIRENHPLTIFLLSGQRIRALVDDYDNFTLLLRDGERQLLYYKHAISTINR